MRTADYLEFIELKAENSACVFLNYLILFTNRIIILSRTVRVPIQMAAVGVRGSSAALRSHILIFLNYDITSSLW